MARDVDERKKRAALRKLRKAAALAEQGLGPPLSDWEVEFLEEVEERIEKYGSAFADPEKGADGEALSVLQQVKLKEIDKKARGKSRRTSFNNKKSSFKTKSNYSPRGRDINDDVESEDVSQPPPKRDFKPELVKASELLPPKPDEKTPPEKPSANPARKTPTFRVIDGGKAD